MLCCCCRKNKSSRRRCRQKTLSRPDNDLVGRGKNYSNISTLSECLVKNDIRIDANVIPFLHSLEARAHRSPCFEIKDEFIILTIHIAATRRTSKFTYQSRHFYTRAKFLFFFPFHSRLKQSRYNYDKLHSHI